MEISSTTDGDRSSPQFHDRPTNSNVVVTEKDLLEHICTRSMSLPTYNYGFKCLMIVAYMLRKSKYSH